MTSVTPTVGAGLIGAGPDASLPVRAAPRHGAIAGVPSRLVGGRTGEKAAGLLLRLDPRTEDGDDFEIVIVGPVGEALMVLGPFAEEDVVAVWRSLAAASGLPLMIQGEDGAVREASPQIGRVQLGAIRIRRRHGLLNGRRPRFLVRRKATRLPRRPIVHREPEIVGGAAG